MLNYIQCLDIYDIDLVLNYTVINECCKHKNEKLKKGRGLVAYFLNYNILRKYERKRKYISGMERDYSKNTKKIESNR